jgi:hypothetical protein
METRRSAVFACVARTQPGSALSEELRLRVRLRATFEKGRIASALFHTETQGYGFIDKYRHICIVEALAPLRLQPSSRGADAVVTYTYTFGDAGAPSQWSAQ